MSTKVFLKIPQWVYDYNEKGYQSGAGKALKITLDNFKSVANERQELIGRLENLVNQAELVLSDIDNTSIDGPEVRPHGLRMAIADAKETLKKLIQ